MSALDVKVADGEADRPARYGPFIEELQTRGTAHEMAYLQHLRNLGLNIDLVASSDSGQWSHASGVERTLAAMKAGKDIIYQAALSDNTWSGKADFLRIKEECCDLGDWSYEVIDTKLARETKAGTILQLCVYSDLLGKMQGKRPESMYVVTPSVNFEPEEYRVEDYAAYFRLLDRRMTDFVLNPSDTFPEMVGHCDYCAWWTECEKRRRGADHLCYVAGISRAQIKVLDGLGVSRLTELAALDPMPKLTSGSREAMMKVRDQARVQMLGRDRGAPYHELKTPFGFEHGFALLPEPTLDDIFLDLEGNHFSEEGVKEYLFGYLTIGPQGALRYTSLWAETPDEERAAFQRFIGVATAMRARNPGAHVYHFAPYEPTALKGLMGRYGTCEVPLDELLRGKVFVDLYAVVKRSLVASVESYSIKDLEPFYGYERGQDLRVARMSRRILENAIEVGKLDDRLTPHKKAVEDYNREDCESTLRLRTWLEQLRSEIISRGHDIGRPPTESGAAFEPISELDRKLQRLRDGLLEDLPENADERNPEQQAYFVLAHMMEFHRREDKATWWEYFRVLDLEQGEYEDERRVITGLEFKVELVAGSAPVHRYRFPYQELDARTGDDLRDVEGNRFGTVEKVNYAERWIDVKKRRDTATLHQSALLLHSQVSSKVLQESLIRMGETVLEEGFTSQVPYRAAFDLLLRQTSPLVGENGALQKDHETAVQAACRLAVNLDGHVLAIQGPPGTGKTYTGAQMVCELKKRGLTVGVTAVSHKVIVNLLEAVMKEAQKQDLELRAVHKQSSEYEGEWGIECMGDYPSILHGLEVGEIDILGATAWCWSREDFEQSVDVLIG